MNWLADLRQDVRFGLRSLRRTPSFAVTAIVTVALAIAANTTIFSFVRSLLLDSLPYRAPRELVAVEANVIGSIGEMLALRERTTTIADLALYRNRSITLNDDREAARVDGVAVTANLIALLGVPPALGAGFADDASRPGAGDVVLLSHSAATRASSGAGWPWTACRTPWSASCRHTSTSPPSTRVSGCRSP